MKGQHRVEKIAYPDICRIAEGYMMGRTDISMILVKIIHDALM